MGSKIAPKSRLKCSWLPRSIFRAFWSNFWDMWEEKTMQKNMEGVFKIKLCRPLDPTEFQKRFWSDFAPIFEPFRGQFVAIWAPPEPSWARPGPREGQNGAAGIDTLLSGNLLAPSWCQRCLLAPPQRCKFDSQRRPK